MGLFTALHLRHRQHTAPIILIEPHSRFVFKPMLYELLTGELPESVVCPSYKELLKNSDIEHHQDHVTKIDLQHHQLQLISGEQLAFNNLVLAVGSVQGYLGAQGADQHAFAFRTREEAIALKNHLQACLRQSLASEDPEERQRLLTIAIVGAGPSGVEMAATLADLLPSWYAPMGGDVHQLSILLVNHAPKILAGDANTHLKTTALAALENRTIRVELKLGVGVKGVTESTLTYVENQTKTEQTLATCSTIWTAGTAVNPLIKALGADLPTDHLDRHGLPLVKPTLQLPDFPEIFAAGDCASVQDAPQPALAQIAYQQGATIAHNLIALHHGKALHHSEPQLRGTLMKLGLGNGAVNLFDKLQIDGKVGDLIRNATYLELLPTPIHNFKATTRWLEEETINRFHHPHALTNTDIEFAQLNPKTKKEYYGILAIAVMVPIVILSVFFWGFRTPEAERRPFVPTTDAPLPSPTPSGN